MNVRARGGELERKRANRQSPVCPPVEFFDAALAGTVTPQEWNRWGPWLRKNILGPSAKDRPVAETETECTPPIDDEKPSGE
jgi:hypothetical protein